MNAVTKFFWMSSVTSSRARFPEYVTERSLTVNTVSAPRPSGVAASSPSLPESMRGVVMLMNLPGVSCAADSMWGAGW